MRHMAASWKHLVCQITPHFSRLISTKPSDSWQQRMSPYFPIILSLAYSCSKYNSTIRLFTFLVYFNISDRLKNDSQLNTCIADTKRENFYFQLPQKSKTRFWHYFRQPLNIIKKESKIKFLCFICMCASFPCLPLIRLPNRNVSREKVNEIEVGNIKEEGRKTFK